MKQAILLSLLFLGSFTTQAQESMAGQWNTGRENTIIEMKQDGSEWLGTILSSENEKAEIGKLMVKELQKKGEGFEGKIYVIRRERWMEAYFEPEGNSMKVTVSAGMMKRSIDWTKEK